MSNYQKKYTLEFDDVIEGEFNDYRLEIFKKYEIFSRSHQKQICFFSHRSQRSPTAAPPKII